MAVGKKVEDESEARRCLAAARRSGLSAGEWARDHGVDERPLHAWQVNLERRETGAQGRRRGPKAVRASGALVELVLAVPSAAMVGGGRYWGVLAKRQEAGSFQLPPFDGCKAQVAIEGAAFASLLAGIDLPPRAAAGTAGLGSKK